MSSFWVSIQSIRTCLENCTRPFEMGIQKGEGQLLEKYAKIVTLSPLARNDDLILPHPWLFNPLADKEHDIWPPPPPLQLCKNQTKNFLKLFGKRCITSSQMTQVQIHSKKIRKNRRTANTAQCCNSFKVQSMIVFLDCLDTRSNRWDVWAC